MDSKVSNRCDTVNLLEKFFSSVYEECHLVGMLIILNSNGLIKDNEVTQRWYCRCDFHN